MSELTELEQLLEQASTERADGWNGRFSEPRSLVTDAARTADFRLRLLRRHLSEPVVAPTDLFELLETVRWLERSGHERLARALALTLI